MLTSLKSTVHRARERARLRRDYEFLLRQSDAMFKDIGVARGQLHHAVMHARDTN
jgi:uncharacterized protein YjiS (DUF1127 family)